MADNVSDSSKGSGKRRNSVKNWGLDGPQLAAAFRSQRRDAVRDLRREELRDERERAREEHLAKIREEKKAAQIIVSDIRPSIHTRVDLTKPYSFHLEEGQKRPEFVMPVKEKQIREAMKRRKLKEIKYNFCKYDHIELPKPGGAAEIQEQMEAPSPEPSKAAVIPRKPSMRPSAAFPPPPGDSELELKKPKSGIYINEQGEKPKVEFYDSFDLVFKNQPRPEKEKRVVFQKKKIPWPKKHMTRYKLKEIPVVTGSLTPEQIAEMFKAATSGPGEGEEEGGDDGALLESYLTKQFRRKVSQASKCTSVHERSLLGLPAFGEDDLEQIPVISRIIQKFRRDSEMERYKPPLRTFKRGTLESHSFTELEQKTLQSFYFGSKCGTMHQGDPHFGEDSRDHQGICMPVAAYCYTQIKNPRKWTEANLDEILEIGDRLYRDSYDRLHLHEEKRDLGAQDLRKYVTIGDKRIRFEIHEPEISGMIRSEDKKVYNLSKGLKIFYKRHRAGIFQTYDVNILIWKEKHFYFYDATPRMNDMIPDPKGAARLANFYDVPSILTILLNRSRLGNWPFILSKISIVKVQNKDELQEDPSASIINERSDYFVWNEKKAVVQATFDLGDMCFDFSRNKQAMAMAVICLVYSRITPPSAWHQKTLDKIMTIGNQLYLECTECDQISGELRLDDLPAAFTLGPYLVEIYIYANRYADLMYRKADCEFHRCLEEFFEKNTNAIVQIGGAVLAVWLQRDVYYCFDPYSRNNEGFVCRNGAACVSMNSDLETMVETIVTNFDKRDAVFYIHALKVLKIHRDPAQADLFPKNMTMNDYSPETFKKYKMKKSKKSATAKPITVDYTEFAAKVIHVTESPGESLIEVGSTVESLSPDQLPPQLKKYPSRSALRTNLPKCEKMADLDSPSLSDTQIYPRRPRPEDEEDLAGGMDLDQFELTVEELDMLDQGEGEEGGEGGEGGILDGVDELDAYMAMSIYSQVNSASLDSYHSKLSAQINTDVTCGFLPLRREVLPPTNLARKKRLARENEQKKVAKKKREGYFEMEDVPMATATQSEELAKEHNFVTLPDGTQLIRGTQNMINYGTELEYMAPFVCMMAAVVAQKYTIVSWSPEIVDYVLKCGAELYGAAKIRYDQVPKIIVPKITLGRDNYSIVVDYIFDSYLKIKILEMALKKILFKKSDCGILVTPSYACALFEKNHLYYMYDGFGCNELGLGEGAENTGVACFSRFLDIHSLARRIMYNKRKRESTEKVGYTRFVISTCRAKPVREEDERFIRTIKIEMGEGLGEAEEGPPPKLGQKSDIPRREPVGEPTNYVGYQFHEGFMTIQGTKALKGRNAVIGELKEDHFACLCACLMLINCPIKKWDTKKVDYVIDQGQHIFSHAEDLDLSDKRIIRNMLIDKYFFDIIVRRFEIPNQQNRRNLSIAISTVLTKKHNYCLVQFPNACYVLHYHDDFYHMFDPYACTPNGKPDPSESGCAGWTMFRDLNQMVTRLKMAITGGVDDCNFYTFDVTAFKKAPKKVLVAQRLRLYELDKTKKEEVVGRPLHENINWLKISPIPWSMESNKTANGNPRGRPENKWHEWEIEYKNDLYSLTSTFHQNSDKFPEEYRGKQTLANLIVGIGMTDIYELSEWNSTVMDSILINGQKYFEECIANIAEPDYELSMEDLKNVCTIFPYAFKILYQPILHGTMFLLRVKQFNMYKAIRMFMQGYENRCGIAIATKEEQSQKRIVAFGKIREREYFMFDCDCVGPPMFVDGHSSRAYILRMTSLNRLVYVLALTLRGGDFYIYEVETSDFKPID